MKYGKNYKRRSALPRKIIASGLSVTFCASAFSSYAGAMEDKIEYKGRPLCQIIKDDKGPKIVIAASIITIILFCVFFIPYAKERKKLKNQNNSTQGNEKQEKEEESEHNVPEGDSDKSQKLDSKALQALKFALLTAIGGGTGVASFHEIDKHLINSKAKKILTESNNKSGKTKIESKLADTDFTNTEINNEKDEHSTKSDAIDPKLVLEKNTAKEKTRIEKTNRNDDHENESTIKNSEDAGKEDDFENSEHMKAENNNTVKNKNKTSANIKDKNNNPE